MEREHRPIGIRVNLPEFEFVSCPTFNISDIRHRRFYDSTQLKIYLKSKIIGRTSKIFSINKECLFIVSDIIIFNIIPNFISFINDSSFNMIGKYLFNNCKVCYYSNIYYFEKYMLLENVHINFESIKENFITNIKII